VCYSYLLGFKSIHSNESFFMKNLILLLTAFLIIPNFVFSQGDNCLNPKIVNVACPSVVSLTNEGTAGFTNDRTMGAGNDVVYQVTVPAGSKYLLVSITNPTGPLYLFSTNNSCSAGTYYYQYVSYSRENIMIPLTGTGPYYIWVDPYNTSDITYSISFGVIETSTYYSIPNTKGNWGASLAAVCAGVSLAKPGAYAEILWNGVHQNIVTYSPLGTPGIVTSKIQLKNTTGVEGVKKITFTFDPALTNTSATASSIPGFYNAGNWISSKTGNVITWTFVDAAGAGWGDFNGVSSNCLIYEFSFNMTPTSNSPALTNVKVLLYPDGKGSPSSGYTNTGCCPTPGNCPVPLSGASTGGPGGAIGFGFNDPALPVNLISFDVSSNGQYPVLHWQTASEHNSEKFDVELSGDGINYNLIGSVPSAGESASPLSYEFIDNALHNYSITYYRLKQVDRDGVFTYSKVISHGQNISLTKIYPNPVNGTLYIESISNIKHGILYDQMGKPVLKIDGATDRKSQYDVSELKPGIYFLSIELEREYITERIIIE
jgi:hypothetical protein